MTKKKHEELVKEIVYQIRDKESKVLAQFASLVQARVASVEIKGDKEIVERSFIDGEWEEVILYERA